MSLDRFTEATAFSGFERGFAALSGHRDLATALSNHAEEAAALLKALSHEGRLMILCHLAQGEKSVSEIEALIGQRQAAVSQQLARLRLEGLVSTRRDGKAIYYTIRDARVFALLNCLPPLFTQAA